MAGLLVPAAEVVVVAKELLAGRQDQVQPQAHMAAEVVVVALTVLERP